MDQSVPSPTDSLGEEGFQLSWATPLRLCHYLLAQVRGLETGSKLDFIQCDKLKEQDKLWQLSTKRIAHAYPARQLS